MVLSISEKENKDLYHGKKIEDYCLNPLFVMVADRIFL